MSEVDFRLGILFLVFLCIQSKQKPCLKVPKVCCPIFRAIFRLRFYPKIISLGLVEIYGIMVNMTQAIFSLSSHFLFAFISFQLLYKVVDWGRFFKVRADNERAIRLLVIFISLALGYLVSHFFISIYEVSRSIFRAGLG